MRKEEYEEGVAQIERTQVELKKVVAFGDEINKLMDSPSYRAVIEKGYLTDECVRLVHCLADPAFNEEQGRGEIIKQMDGIAYLKSYLSVGLMMGQKAKGDIASAIDALDELQAHIDEYGFDEEGEE